MVVLDKPHLSPGNGVAGGIADNSRDAVYLVE
jgi:hypothetical protein